ncbi:MAG: nitrous oxide reductase accessory protein NosL [Pseudomonadota bacterium]
MVASMRNITCLLALCALTLTAWATPVLADAVDLPDGSKLDPAAICPVCTMKVGAGKLGPAAVVFKDGKVVSLDGSGDLFRYLLSPSKYGFNPSDIKALFATDYGTKKFVDAKAAFYVLGSDLTGGMGPEAIAFSKQEDAEKFKAEHKAKRVAPFSMVTLNDLQAGKKKMLKMKH